MSLTKTLELGKNLGTYYWRHGTKAQEETQPGVEARKQVLLLAAGQAGGGSQSVLLIETVGRLEGSLGSWKTANGVS